MRALPVLAMLCLASPALAEPIHGKPSHGTFAEMDLGATGFLGETQRWAAPGPSFGLRAGHDLFRWLSLGVSLGSSVHEATVPPPPDQEFFQLHTVAADGRLTVRAGRLAFFVEGGAGLAVISTNVLDKVLVTDPEERVSPAFHAGGGLAWHWVNRHFSMGLAGDWSLLPDFGATQSVNVRLYLRYTR